MIVNIQLRMLFQEIKTKRKYFWFIFACLFITILFSAATNLSSQNNVKTQKLVSKFDVHQFTTLPTHNMQLLSAQDAGDPILLSYLSFLLALVGLVGVAYALSFLTKLPVKQTMITVGVIAVIGFGINFVYHIGYQKGYMPKQPIAFSHKIHAGQLKMSCFYCHADVERSPHAGVPSVSTCMNCHSQVAIDRPEIKKLQKAYETQTPVEWIKVTNLPDYVQFNHSIHIAKGVSCINCHGDIAKMKQVYQAKDMSMGMCIHCHRDPANRVIPKDTIHQKADINCTTCHR